MSHGKKRPVEIAMWLVTGPQVLLLDEPLAGMDLKKANACWPCSRACTPGTRSC